jgi:uncharacterized membrane protein YwzB
MEHCSGIVVYIQMFEQSIFWILLLLTFSFSLESNFRFLKFMWTIIGRSKYELYLINIHFDNKSHPLSFFHSLILFYVYTPLQYLKYLPFLMLNKSMQSTLQWVMMVRISLSPANAVSLFIIRTLNVGDYSVISKK